MSLSAIVLRVVLCLALAANGIAGATAALRMPTSASPAAAVGSAVAPCHDALDASTDQPTAKHAAPHGACCHAGACACHGVTQAPVLVASTIDIAVPLPHDAVVQAPAGARESPRRVHLIRPPISPAC
jgi:hypothetical protein